MIKKLLSVLVLVFALSGSVLAQQSMSDQQVLEYVKTGMQQGKDQRQIATELARRGVTQEQAKRVKKLYEQQMGLLIKTQMQRCKIGTVCVKRQRRRKISM